MAEEEEHEPIIQQQQQQQEEMQTTTNEDDLKKLVTSYMGLGLGLFMAHLPKSTVSAVQKLEGEVREMRWRRQEDAKGNAKVAEIFASHRHAWQQEEKRLLRQIDTAAEEIARLRGTLVELQKEKDEVMSFVSRSRRNGEKLEEEGGLGLRGCRSRECYGVGACNSGSARDWFRKEEDEEEEGCVVGSTRSVEEEEVTYEHAHTYEHDEHAHTYEHEHDHAHSQQHQELLGIGIGNGFDSEFMASASSKFWAEKASLWQVC